MVIRHFIGRGRLSYFCLTAIYMLVGLQVVWSAERVVSVGIDADTMIAIDTNSNACRLQLATMAAALLGPD